MLGLFKKKSKLMKQIASEGVTAVSQSFGQFLTSELGGNPESMREYVLADLLGATTGGEVSKNFVANSGVSPAEYDDDNAQMPAAVTQAIDTLNNATMSLADDQETMVDFRLGVLDYIMMLCRMGKYSLEQVSTRIGDGPQNHHADKKGFVVKDPDTSHVLYVNFDGKRYSGAVMMYEQEASMPLQDWPRGANPFQDQRRFKGRAPDDSWFFCVDTNTPYSQILQRVESNY